MKNKTVTLTSMTFLSTILLTSLIATAGIQTAHATTETITLRSDSSNTFLATPDPGKPFQTAFTAADFAAASAGPNAFVIGNHNAWKPHLDSDPTGTYISVAPVNPNHHGPNSALVSALYAVDFEVTGGSVVSATLDIDYLVDNNLGWTFEPTTHFGADSEGLFVNGIPVVGTKSTPQFACHFCSDNSLTGLDITSMVHPGVNTLYLYAADYGQPQGLQYLANITVESTSVVPVSIDIKPGSDPSSWNCKNTKGGVPVAVFSSEDFDASTIDPSTLTIEGISTSEVHNKVHLEDKNDDGLTDAVLHLDSASVCEAASNIPLKETGFVTLAGSTTDDVEFEGTGDIRIVKR